MSSPMEDEKENVVEGRKVADGERPLQNSKPNSMTKNRQTSLKDFFGSPLLTPTSCSESAQSTSSASVCKNSTPAVMSREERHKGRMEKAVVALTKALVRRDQKYFEATAAKLAPMLKLKHAEEVENRLIRYQLCKTIRDHEFQLECKNATGARRAKLMEERKAARQANSTELYDIQREMRAHFQPDESVLLDEGLLKVQPLTKVKWMSETGVSALQVSELLHSLRRPLGLDKSVRFSAEQIAVACGSGESGWLSVLAPILSALLRSIFVGARTIEHFPYPVVRLYREMARTSLHGDWSNIVLHTLSMNALATAEILRQLAEQATQSDNFHAILRELDRAVVHRLADTTNGEMWTVEAEDKAALIDCVANLFLGTDHFRDSLRDISDGDSRLVTLRAEKSAISEKLSKAAEKEQEAMEQIPPEEDDESRKKSLARLRAISAFEQAQKKRAQLKSRLSKLQYEIRAEAFVGQRMFRTQPIGTDRSHRLYFVFGSEMDGVADQAASNSIAAADLSPNPGLFILDTTADDGTPLWAHIANEVELDALLETLSDKGQREAHLKRRIQSLRSFILRRNPEPSSSSSSSKADPTKSETDEDETYDDEMENAEEGRESPTSPLQDATSLAHLLSNELKEFVVQLRDAHFVDQHDGNLIDETEILSAQQVGTELTKLVETIRKDALHENLLPGGSLEQWKVLMANEESSAKLALHLAAVDAALDRMKSVLNQKCHWCKRGKITASARVICSECNAVWHRACSQPHCRRGNDETWRCRNCLEEERRREAAHQQEEEEKQQQADTDESEDDVEEEDDDETAAPVREFLAKAREFDPRLWSALLAVPEDMPTRGNRKRGRYVSLQIMIEHDYDSFKEFEADWDTFIEHAKRHCANNSRRVEQIEALQEMLICERSTAA